MDDSGPATCPLQAKPSAEGRSTRRKSRNKHHFGDPQDLPNNNLPTKRDVLRYIAKLIDELPFSDRYRSVPIRTLVTLAAEKVTSIWERAIADRTLVPLIDNYAIEKRIERLYRTAMRSYFKQTL